jgi:hypothetical protein
MPATRSDNFQRSHPSRHQRERDPQVATDLPGSIARNLASFRSGKGSLDTAHWPIPA